MPRLTAAEKEAHLERYRRYIATKEEPSEPVPVPSGLPVGSLAYRQAIEGRVEMTPEIIEQQIVSVYKQAPIVEQPDIYARVRGGEVPTKQVYAPTPKQEEQIISLAMQLPPEKRAKYIIEPPEEPKGIAETLVSVRMEDVQSFVAVGIADIARLKGERRERFLGRHAAISPYLQPQVAPFKEPVQTLGGMVASFEAPVYTVGRLVGFETPRPPPTYVSGVIGAGLGSPEELADVMEYGPSYAAGTILGDILLSYVTGKATGWAAGKVWTGTKWVVAKAIPQPVKLAYWRHVKLPLKMDWYASQVRADVIATKAKMASWKYQLSALKWHLPKRLQKALFPTEYSFRQIEKAFGWVPTKTGYAGYLEKTYGLPFYTQQTLQRPMVTKEWARQVYLESILPRMQIEKQLGWVLGTYPGFGVSPEKVAEPLSFTEMMEQAERVPTFDLEKAFRKTLVGKELRTEVISVGVVPTGKETIFTYRGAFEFGQLTKMKLPTRFFIPTSKVKDFFMVARGFPTTPFEKTLGRAIGVPLLGGLVGGVPAAQLILRAPEVPAFLPEEFLPEEFLAAPTKGLRLVDFEELFFMIPKAARRRGVSGLGFSLGALASTLTRPRLKQPSRLKRRLVQRALQLPIVKQALQPLEIPVVTQETAQKLKLPQLQKQLLRTVQVQKQRMTTQQRQVLAVMRPSAKAQAKAMRSLLPPMLRQPTEKRKKKKPLFGAWFFRRHPIATPEQLMKTLTGGKKPKQQAKLLAALGVRPKKRKRRS